jgi:hypothetical protein
VLKSFITISLICITGIIAVSASAQVFPGDAYLGCMIDAYSEYNECMTNRGDFPKGQWPKICNTGLSTMTAKCGPKPPDAFFPKFVVVGLLYSPPGNASNSGFSISATSGTNTTFGTNIATTSGVSLLFTAPLPLDTNPLDKPQKTTPLNLAISGSFQTATQTQGGFMTTVSSTGGQQIKSSKDMIDHSQDTIFLWLNARFAPALSADHKFANLALTPATSSYFDIVPITVAELTDPTLIPDWKKNPQIIRNPDGTQVSLPGLSSLTADDLKALLALDPLAGRDPSAQPTDSRYFDTGLREPLEGPDKAGDVAVSYTANLTQGQQKSLTHQSQQQYSTGVSLSFPILGSLSLAQTFTITSAITTSSGSGQQTSAMLGSSTAGCCNVSPTGQGGACMIDVYEDMLFQTYAFIPEPYNCGGALPNSPHSIGAPTGLKGQLLGAASAPLAHSPVTITLSDGKTLTVISDSKGNFSLYGVPAGKVTVSSGNTVQTQTIGTGQTTAVQLKMLK